jgi:hypothetical protein
MAGHQPRRRLGFDHRHAGRVIVPAGGYHLSVTSPPVDLERERTALLELHASVRRAHFETDAEAVVAHDADEWINVRDATITQRHRDEMAAFFRGYFAGATYNEWDDVVPPIVSVSDDGTLAWMIVHVRVRRTADDVELRFTYAGIETYEKRDGRWVKVVEVGTFVEG